jgi:ferredoxin, 2Fe-2S
MALIVIKNLEEKTIEVQDFSKTILQHVQGNGIDWMFACGGKGRCTTCKAIVLHGLENLEPKTAAAAACSRVKQKNLFAGSTAH